MNAPYGTGVATTTSAQTPRRSGCKGAAGARKGRERLGQGGQWGTELPKERHPGLGNEAKELQLLRLASATEGRGLHLPCATPGSHHFQFLNSEQTPRPLQWAVTPSSQWGSIYEGSNNWASP